MQSQAETVEEYLAELPEDRREALAAIREEILKNLPKGYEEGMQYGMIGYYVPHSIFPAGYHCDPKQPLPFAGLGSQKNHMGLYLFCIYGEGGHEQWFREAWTGAGKKLDMGKACVRFKKLDDVPLEVVGKLVKRIPVKKFVAFYESSLAENSKRTKKTTKKKTTKKATAKKTAKATTKKTAKKKTSTKKTTKATTKAVAKKSTAKKATAKKKTTTKKTVAKKAAIKKSTTKKKVKKAAKKKR